MLDLSENTALGNLPHDIQLPDSLEKLSLLGTNMTDLPKSVSNLAHLEEVDMSDCKHLNEIPDSLQYSTSIYKMMFHNTNIRSVPSWIWEMDSLTE